MDNDKKKEQKFKLVILLFGLIVLIILVNIIKTMRNRDEIWNYSEISSAIDVISEGIVVNDRGKYYILEDIVIRFLLANGEGTVDNLESNNINYEATYADYYSILVDDYKRHLSKNEFEEVSNTFANKFITISAEGYKYLNTKNIIKSIYLYGNNKYLCFLNSGSDNLAFFGVELNEDNKSYNIFYVE